MFEADDVSNGFPFTCDRLDDVGGAANFEFFITDSMQDMLDIDIRAEVATVVGGVNEFTSLMSDLPTLDILDTQHSSSSSSGYGGGCGSATDPELMSWCGGSKWSATLVANSDVFADGHAWINPNSLHSHAYDDGPTKTASAAAAAAATVQQHHDYHIKSEPEDELLLLEEVKEEQLDDGEDDGEEDGDDDNNNDEDDEELDDGNDASSGSLDRDDHASNASSCDSLPPANLFASPAKPQKPVMMVRHVVNTKPAIGMLQQQSPMMVTKAGMPLMKVQLHQQQPHLQQQNSLLVPHIKQEPLDHRHVVKTERVMLGATSTMNGNPTMVTTTTTAPKMMSAAGVTTMQQLQQQQQHQQRLLPLKVSNNGMVGGAQGHVVTTMASNTIKLAPGIGGLTFANSMMYAKIKQGGAITIPNSGNGAGTNTGATTTTINVNGTNKIVTNVQNVQFKRGASPHRTMIGGKAHTIITANGQQHHHQQQMMTTTTTSAASNSQTLINGHVQSQPQKVFARSLIVQTNKLTGGPQLVEQMMPATSSHQQQQQHHHHHNIQSAANSTTTSTSGTTVLMHKTTTTLHKPVKPASGGSSPATASLSEYPKPSYSYSCLIALALKNSRAGSLPVSEIYSFICEHFPYFKTAAPAWKNSVRHNLSLNNCFSKIEKPATNGGQRKGCLWTMNPARIAKMDNEIQKWLRKDPTAVHRAMVRPEMLTLLERGEVKHGSICSEEVEVEMVDDDVDGLIDEDLMMDGDAASEEGDVAGRVSRNSSSGGSGSSQHHYLDMDEVGMVVQAQGSGVANATATMLTAGGGGGGGESVGHLADDEELLQEIKQDFNIEITDVYDELDDMQDENGTPMHLQLDDLAASVVHDDIDDADADDDLIEHSQPKRVKYDVNYSIAAANTFQVVQQHQQQQQQQHSHQQFQPLHQHQQTVTTTPTQPNRRKMTLVNRVL